MHTIDWFDSFWPFTCEVIKHHALSSEQSLLILFSPQASTTWYHYQLTNICGVLDAPSHTSLLSRSDNLKHLYIFPIPSKIKSKFLSSAFYVSSHLQSLPFDPTIQANFNCWKLTYSKKPHKSSGAFIIPLFLEWALKISLILPAYQILFLFLFSSLITSVLLFAIPDR